MIQATSMNHQSSNKQGQRLQGMRLIAGKRNTQLYRITSHWYKTTLRDSNIFQSEMTKQNNIFPKGFGVTFATADDSARIGPWTKRVQVADTIWLVVDLPLWKIWKSVGMIIPNIWENKIHVPNHQPAMVVEEPNRDADISWSIHYFLIIMKSPLWVKCPFFERSSVHVVMGQNMVSDP